MRFKKLLIIAIILGFSANICSVLAYEMSSENYRLQIEGIDMGAIGDMKDFSESDKGFFSTNNLKEVFNSCFSWKMALILLIVILIISSVFYLVVKKISVPKK